jgi:nitrogen fixation protein FixH
MPASPAEARRSRWIPWTFVGGFGVVIAANLVLIVFALTSWSGLETEQAYQKGLAYNRTLDAISSQAARGWQGALSFEPSGSGAGRLALAITDAAGEPVDGLNVTARLIRPTHEGFDTVLALPAAGSGRYEAALYLPLAGQWRVEIEASGRGAPYTLSGRIMVR